MTTTFTDLLTTAGRSVTGEVIGPQYAILVSYSPPPVDRAKVQPILAAVGPDGIPRVAPVMGPLPVVWPRGSGGSLTWPLAPGDVVRLAPLERDHSLWIGQGSQGEPPKIPGKWDLAFSVVEPFAVGPQGGALAAGAYSQLGPVLFGSQVFLVSATAGDFMALASKVTQELLEIRTWALAHGHPAFGTQASPTAPPLLPTVAMVGSTKIHGE